MKFIEEKELTNLEKRATEEAFEAAKHSFPRNRHKVGCAIINEDGMIFSGAVNARSKAIGSTCAERMAVDQLYFNNPQKIAICAPVGIFLRENWSDDFICTPCGACLEMFSEVALDFGMEDIDFICPSWNKKRYLRIKLSELYPQVGKGKWNRYGHE